MIPEDDHYSAPPAQPRRLGRRSVVAWLILALIVVGAIASLLIWVSQRLGSVAA